MIKPRIFVDDKLIYDARMTAAPRVGDTIRYGGEDDDKYAKVVEVIWCLNEYSNGDDRVNIRCESITAAKEDGNG